MNYQKMYKALVDSRKYRGVYKIDLDYYTESHHIVPKSLGGSDGVWNKVLLTPREHFIAHLLLVKIYPDSKEMKQAMILMKGRGKIVNSKMFTRLRQDVAEMSKGARNHFFGKTHTPENREIMGNARRGKKMPASSIERTRLANLGSKRSEEAIKNMSEAAINKNLSPWQTSGCLIRPHSLQFWAVSDIIYDLWYQADKIGPRRLCKIYNEVFCDTLEHFRFTKICQMFSSGWIPSEDCKWLTFKETMCGR